MSRKILVLQGSARKNRNTATLAKEFCRGAEEAGHEITYISLAGMTINGCRDCKHCFSHEGQCIQQDDMQKIYEYLHTHDTLVLATPVYFFGMTAQIKAPLDRMYAGLGKPFGIKSMALLVTFQDSNEAIVQPLIDQYRIMTEFCKYQDEGMVYVNDLNVDEVDINKSPKLQDAFELGRSFS